MIRTWLRRRGWLGHGHEHESVLLKQVLQDYARVVADAARRDQLNELTIARLQAEQAWIYRRLRAHLTALRAIVAPADLPADLPDSSDR